MYWIMGHQGIIYADPAYRIQAIIFFSAQMALGLTSDAYSLITVRSRFKEFSLMNAFFLEMWLLGGIFILLVGIPVRFNELLLATGMYYDYAMAAPYMAGVREKESGGRGPWA